MDRRESVAKPPTIMGLELVFLQKLSSPYLPPPPHTLTKCRSFNSCTILAAWLSMGIAFGLVRNRRKRHRAAVCFTPSVVSLCREYTELSIWLIQICVSGPHISAYYSVDVLPVLNILGLYNSVYYLIFILFFVSL